MVSLSASESRRRRLACSSSAERSARAADRDRVDWTREASDKCHLPGEHEQLGPHRSPRGMPWGTTPSRPRSANRLRAIQRPAPDNRMRCGGNCLHLLKGAPAARRAVRPPRRAAAWPPVPSGAHRPHFQRAMNAQTRAPRPVGVGALWLGPTAHHSDCSTCHSTVRCDMRKNGNVPSQRVNGSSSSFSPRYSRVSVRLRGAPFSFSRCLATRLIMRSVRPDEIPGAAVTRDLATSSASCHALTSSRHCPSRATRSLE